MTHGMLEPSDKQFIDRFDQCLIPKDQWTHTAHIRMAWIQFNRSKDFAEAMDRIRLGIQKLNASLGSIGYHETVTVAYARLIYERLLLQNQAHRWIDFFQAHQDLVAKEPSILAPHYSAESLSSAQSKIRFVEPKLKPLPLAGIIRDATQDDVAAMLEIYAPFIKNTSVTFEISIPSVIDFTNKWIEIKKLAPWLIYEWEGRVVGYVYASKHREREAYRWSIEVSAYIDTAFHRRGVARILYSALFRRLKAQGFCMALAGITLPNESSVRFHEAMGFERIGVYKKIGFKMGAWHDVGWWQKSLQGPEFVPGLILGPGMLNP